MSQKLWVAHKTPAKTFGPTRVSIEGCEYVDDFLNSLYNRPLLAIPQNTPITLYNSDGTTEIDVGASPADYMEGNSRRNPLIVRSIPTMPTMDYGATWKVSGIIENSLSVKGVRSRMYRHADNQLGYYEQDQPAFYYDESGENLKINVLLL
jgi:hypothetical protein